jgi:uncharacterized protein YbjT (DUF2867 family)
VRGSFTDREVIRGAMKDAYGVFSMQPSAPGAVCDEEELRSGIAVADLAAESGVTHLIYSSGASVGDKPTGVARFDNKPRIEAHIRSLPVTATIVRPMIFMEMVPRPGFGLDEGRFTFFLRPDQSMQLIAVEDIGKFVAAIFADKARFSGKTLKIASDTVTGRELGVIFSEAAGRPIAYERFSDEVLAADPEILSFRSWLAGNGREAFDKDLGMSGERDHPSA